jgi:hypothetical protein
MSFQGWVALADRPADDPTRRGCDRLPVNGRPSSDKLNGAAAGPAAGGRRGRLSRFRERPRTLTQLRRPQCHCRDPGSYRSTCLATVIDLAWGRAVDWALADHTEALLVGDATRMVFGRR